MLKNKYDNYMSFILIVLHVGVVLSCDYGDLTLAFQSMFYRMRTQTYGTINGMSLEFSLTSINIRNYPTLD